VGQCDDETFVFLIEELANSPLKVVTFGDDWPKVQEMDNPTHSQRYRARR
jgi:IS1 family transposase